MLELGAQHASKEGDEINGARRTRDGEEKGREAVVPV